jgi:hypothetical protein
MDLDTHSNPDIRYTICCTWVTSSCMARKNVKKNGRLTLSSTLSGYSVHDIGMKFGLEK